VSTGQIATEMKTKKGEPTSFAQNPWNAVIAAGHNSGEVSMWVPNMGKAAVTMLTHPSQRVNAIAFHPQGQYMATAGVDSRLRIWDMRTYKKLHDYFVPTQPSGLDFS